MKKALLLLAATFGSAPAFAEVQCVPHQTTVIDAEARCVETGGVNIGLNDDQGIKVACMQNKKVRGTCGPDGQLTRLRAYTTWYKKLKEFEADCLTGGGAFSYQDSNFAEPQNESFCLQAQPEVGVSMFEEPLCNYRSVCPAVTVVCQTPCEGLPAASAPEEPPAPQTALMPPTYDPITGEKIPVY